MDRPGAQRRCKAALPQPVTGGGKKGFRRVIENAVYQGGLRQYSGDSNGLKPACGIVGFLREIMSLKKNHTAH